MVWLQNKFNLLFTVLEEEGKVEGGVMGDLLGVGIDTWIFHREDMINLIPSF